MKRTIQASFALAAAAVVMTGCGGVGAEYSGPTALAGSYAGTWVTSSADHSGSLTVTIANNSRFIGTVRDEVTGETGTWAGRVDQVQNFFSEFKFSSGRTVNVEGSIGGPTSNRISGDGTFTEGGTTQGITFDLVTGTGEE